MSLVNLRCVMVKKELTTNSLSVQSLYLPLRHLQYIGFSKLKWIWDGKNIHKDPYLTTDIVVGKSDFVYL